VDKEPGGKEGGVQKLRARTGSLLRETTIRLGGRELERRFEKEVVEQGERLG